MTMDETTCRNSTELLSKKIMGITPDLADIPHTFLDCPDSDNIIIASDGSAIEVLEPCCGNRYGPRVEFPKGSGFLDPWYCRIARDCDKCPRGFR